MCLGSYVFEFDLVCSNDSFVPNFWWLHVWRVACGVWRVACVSEFFLIERCYRSWVVT